MLRCSKVHASYHRHTPGYFFQLSTFPSVNFQQILTKITWIHFAPFLTPHGVDMFHHLFRNVNLNVFKYMNILPFLFPRFQAPLPFLFLELFQTLLNPCISPLCSRSSSVVAYLLSVRHIKTILTSNAILAFIWNSSNFSSSLKHSLNTEFFSSSSYSLTMSTNLSNSTSSELMFLNCFWSSFS